MVESTTAVTAPLLGRGRWYFWCSCFGMKNEEDNNDNNDDSVAKIWERFPEEVKTNTLEYMDVASLVVKKQVSKQWRGLCTEAIDLKCQNKLSFLTNQELKSAIRNYAGTRWDDTIDEAVNILTPAAAEDCAATYGYPIGKWDVSNVTDFSNLINIAVFKFNEPIGSWDVSNATSMNYMFCNAESFNQDLSSWDVSKVTSMTGMFLNAISFNQDISSWDTLNLTNTDSMFDRAKSFNKDISSWDVSKVTNMESMFADATSFNQDLSSWDVSNVISFRGMFDGAKSFKNGKPFIWGRFGVRFPPWYKVEVM